MTGLDYGRFEALTFDCYGTLIDWESGILAGLRPMLARSGSARPERRAPRGLRGAGGGGGGRPLPAVPRDPPRRTAFGLAARYGVAPDAADADAFANSVGDWPAFPNSTAALSRLHERFRLGVITNCDDDLFARSAERLATRFDWVVTAQAAGSYKPSEHDFEVALERIGLPRERILHVAQSLYHDHVTARRLGFATVWIDRRHDRPGSGATPPADATPDATFPDMASFAAAATAG